MNTKIKPTYLIIAASLMLASCDRDDMIPGGNADGDRKIIFRTSLPGVTSRATEITEDFGYFNVTAFNPADPDLIGADGALSAYIDNETVVKVIGQNTLTSDNCIWPAPGKDGHMSFFAWYPALNADARLVNTSTITDSESVIDYKIQDYRVAPDIADQVDFISAHTTGSMADNLFSGITLNFGHQLSRIEINARGANKSCDIEIAGVRIGGVNVKGTFDFSPAEGSGVWSDREKGDVEYIYRAGDEIITLPRATSQNTSATAVSIMGHKLANGDNCSMLLPTADADGWAYQADPHNTGHGLYIAVLLRVTDSKAQQQYPYTDNKQGPNALNIPVVYLAVDKATGKEISCRLYKKNDTYYTDEACTAVYTVPATETVKGFGWAALPVTADWEPGYVYTYTLDYTYGVGMHAPEVTGTESPVAGDPIISDKVGFTVSVKAWQNGSAISAITVPGS